MNKKIEKNNEKSNKEKINDKIKEWQVKKTDINNQ